MKTPRFVKEVTSLVFVPINTIVCGLLFFLAAMGLSGRLADAGVRENAGYGVLFLLGALVAAVNLLALLPEYRNRRALRWTAYGANAVMLAAGFYMLWGGFVAGAMGGIAPESLYCWGFGLANIVAVAATGE